MNSLLKLMKRQRRAKKVSQCYIAEEMNLTQGRVSDLELGKTELTFSKLEKYIKALDDDGYVILTICIDGNEYQFIG